MHPFRNDALDELEKYKDEALLCKWLPSSQMINLESGNPVAEEKLERIQQAALSEMDEEEFETLKKEALGAKQQAIQAARKAAKASAKAENAAEAARIAGVTLEDADKEKP